MPAPETRTERLISGVFVAAVVIAAFVGPWWVAPVGFVALGVAYGFPDRRDLTFLGILAGSVALAIVIALGLALAIGP